MRFQYLELSLYLEYKRTFILNLNSLSTYKKLKSFLITSGILFEMIEMFKKWNQFRQKLKKMEKIEFFGRNKKIIWLPSTPYKLIIPFNRLFMQSGWSVLIEKRARIL